FSSRGRPSLHSFPTRRSSDLLFVLLLSLIGIYWRPLGQLSTLWPANAVLLGVFLRLPHLVSAPGWIAAAAGLILADLLTGSPLRSEEHTSELQSRENLVCRPL